jgi:hypothetical protein
MKHQPLLSMSVFTLADLEATIRRYRELGCVDETPIKSDYDDDLIMAMILEESGTGEKTIIFYDYGEINGKEN